MTPLASVLTTCHNDGATLGTSLLSAMWQRGRDVEVSVVAHGCTDESHHVLASALALHTGTLDVDVEAATLTQSQALNRAASTARGTWLVVLNADDLLVPDAIRTMGAISENHPDVNCIYSSWQWIGARSDQYHFAPYTGDRRMLVEHQIPGIAAFRRDLWETLGGLDESVGIGADWDFAVRGAARGILRPHKHPEPLWLVRDHGPHVKRLSAQCDHKALRAHMAKHFEAVSC